MPVIQSLLDTDFYILTMGSQILKRYGGIPVTYGLVNRTTSVSLGRKISIVRVREELDNARELRFQPDELDFVANQKNGDKALFPKEFICFLRDFRLPPYELKEKDNGQLDLTFSDMWVKTQFWEVPALRIVQRLYNEALMAEMSVEEKRSVYRTGEERMRQKIDRLRTRPDVMFVDYGTRRADSPDWHEHTLLTYRNELPEQILGTSNVLFAMRHGLEPFGTIAHAPFMVMEAMMRSAAKNHARASHMRVLDDWYDEYGYEYSIPPTDTFTSKWFFDHVFAGYARYFKGTRQDSGDPFTEGERRIACYEILGLDPRRYVGLFSDALDVGRMIELADIFGNRMVTRFGWGTNKTNDLGLPNISIVIKPLRALGRA